jgi:hypothetical protein
MGAFASRMGEPKSRGNDATGLADGKETVPAVRGNDAATIGSKEAGFEIEGPEEMTLGIGKGNG